MARFELELPHYIIEQMQKVESNMDEIFGEMTQAGAKVVMENVKANVPDGIRDSEMMRCLLMTEVYKTPSDDGINTKVAFYGYFTNKNGKKTPAPLVANVYEYGRSNAPFPKQPFMRKSFRKKQIEEAMLKAQRKASGGLLDE